ncbi:MAG: TIGR02757 family protein, partial [Saprospiraceae bacterium]
QRKKQKYAPGSQRRPGLSVFIPLFAFLGPDQAALMTPDNSSFFNPLYYTTQVDVQNLLEAYVARFNTVDFIPSDPISIPHLFSKKQDIEISAFWTAMLSWGQRKTILKSAGQLFERMDFAPHDFICNHQEKDRMRLSEFKHRTFQPEDTYYFLDFLQWYYRQCDSLETGFAQFITPGAPHVEEALAGFHDLFFSMPHAPLRTKKHIPTPKRGSTCKRMNMFLRWMVRKDDKGVDFGLWDTIRPSQLLIPLDVHVERIARRLGLLTRAQVDWAAVLELNNRLRNFDPEDPVKYDFALFGLGVLEKSEHGRA